MPNPVEISVIIPTYNRVDSLLRTLASLYQQSIPPERFEVIVVDDGSNCDVRAAVAKSSRGYQVRCIRQQNRGATLARNVGARESRGDFLVFMDDDITVSGRTLELLLSDCSNEAGVIAMGSLTTRSTTEHGIFSSIMLGFSGHYGSSSAAGHRYADYVECNTELLCMRREDFFAIGMFRDPSGGWPNWDDVDFGYRAHRCGYRLKQNMNATGEHWHYALADLTAYCNWWERAGWSAARLFHRYPEIEPRLSMFKAVKPISWSNDGPRLIARKLVHSVAALTPMLSVLHGCASLMEKRRVSPTLLGPIYRLTVRAHVLRGYRRGLSSLSGTSQ